MSGATMAADGSSPFRRQPEVEVIPSILAADFGHLADQVAEAREAGVTTVQIDVMDGRFVPNISVGLPIVSALRKATSLRLDVHLMIEEPGRYLMDFAQAGADVLTVHAEATRHLHRDVQAIKGLGLAAGVALNPATPLVALEEVLPSLDVALIMTVNPGFGGQEFIYETVPKIRRLRDAIGHDGHHAVIQVDGGIGPDTAGVVTEAGARQLVAGSAVFRAGVSIAEAIASIRTAAAAGLRRQPDSA